jgi:hypothetical protein
MMRRRDFIAGLGSAATWPAVARAQQGERVRRIGVLMGSNENDAEGKRRLSAFTQALADLGWIDGRNPSEGFKERKASVKNLDVDEINAARARFNILSRDLEKFSAKRLTAAASSFGLDRRH